MSAVAGKSKSRIVIGQIASRTGNNPGGLDNEQGAALAVAEVNSQGGLLHGRPLEIVVEDDRTDPSTAVDAFSRLADRQVSAVVGTSFSNASLAVIPSVEAAAIPYISTGAADSQVDPVRPYVFMTPMTGQIVAEQLLRYMRDQDLTKVAVVYDSDSLFAKSGVVRQKSMLRGFGIEFVAELPIHVDARDFESTIEAIDEAAPQAVMAWLTGPPAVGFVGSYPLIRRKKRPLLMSHGAASPAFLSATGAAAEGITMTTPLATVASQLPISEMRRVALAMSDGFQKAYGRTPSQFAVDGYVAVKIIAAAIARANSDSPVAIRDELEQLNLLTPQGHYQYSPTNHSGLSVRDVTVSQVIGGRFTLTEWSKEQLRAAS